METINDLRDTVPAPGGYLITPPTRGAYVHYTNVGTYVSPAAYPLYRISGTACGKYDRPRWSVRPVTASEAVAAVTCPTCLGWARFHAEKESY
jgi:hypothetical protein